MICISPGLRLQRQPSPPMRPRGPQPCPALPPCLRPKRPSPRRSPTPCCLQATLPDASPIRGVPLLYLDDLPRTRSSALHLAHCLCTAIPCQFTIESQIDFIMSFTSPCLSFLRTVATAALTKNFGCTR